MILNICVTKSRDISRRSSYEPQNIPKRSMGNQGRVRVSCLQSTQLHGNVLVDCYAVHVYECTMMLNIMFYLYLSKNNLAKVEYITSYCNVYAKRDHIIFNNVC